MLFENDFKAVTKYVASRLTNYPKQRSFKAKKLNQQCFCYLIIGLELLLTIRLIPINNFGWKVFSPQSGIPELHIKGKMTIIEQYTAGKKQEKIFELCLAC